MNSKLRTTDTRFEYLTFANQDSIQILNLEMYEYRSFKNKILSKLA
jgi:hypothetical protein